jgi:hypothetical protein
MKGFSLLNSLKFYVRVNVITLSLELLCNLPNIWRLGNYNEKQKFQKLMSPTESYIIEKRCSSNPKSKFSISAKTLFINAFQ